jgi:squalene-hopene/tetraprenyl-beta-curcumene cyclase
MLDSARLLAAWHRVRDDLLAERTSAGHWVGELATSALSTATAVSALCLMRDAGCGTNSSLIAGGLAYLISHQNADGGWGDTDKSYSNIATTMLAIAAIHLAGGASEHAALLQRAEAYVDAEGRLKGLRARYGKDKTFVVPILTNCALAGLVPWKDVAPLPFELACVPQSWYRFVKMPVVSYAVPALVAIGQAKFHHDPPWNPFSRAIRAASIERSLKVLQQMQPASGGYLEAVPLTSFVVMSLASMNRADHPVAQAGVQFLINSVRPDGSWPIDTNLATWVTSLAINALGDEERGARDEGSKWKPGTALDSEGDTKYSVRHVEPTTTGVSSTLHPSPSAPPVTHPSSPLPWLLRCQHTERHPFMGADPGGWGWSDLSGAVPDADDTPGALLALHQLASNAASEKRQAIESAVRQGIDWLLNLQNRDGGWPTFCRGWTGLPFDRSGTDLTAHVLRALHAWRRLNHQPDRTTKAIARGWRYIEAHQNADGSWFPLWFGNQERLDEENPIYGTTKVLFAYRDLGRLGAGAVKRAVEYLLETQNPDGGRGGDCREGGSRERETGAIASDVPPKPNCQPPGLLRSSIEETSLATEALLAFPHRPDCESAAHRGLTWLVERVEAGGHREPAPIGFYFAKLWYYERLYPIIFAASALRHAVTAT